MTKKFFIFICFVVLGFGVIQTDEKKYTGFSMWPRQTHMLEMKELKATFSKGSMPMDVEGDEMSAERTPEMQTEKATNSSEGKGSSNKVKRETGAAELSLPLDSNESQPTLGDEVIETKTKRQTARIDNANRLQNLINFPIQLNVLANVLSKLNTGILDSKSTPSTPHSISGSDNTVSSLVNVPVNADAVVNILSSISKGSGPESGSAQGGLVDGVLGGLLPVGGDSSAGLLNGVLEGGDKADLLDGLLGNTLGDMLGALVGGDGLLGKHLGGRDGKGFVSDLVNNLLAGVLHMVDNLLQLLIGLLDELLLVAGGIKDDSVASGPTHESDAAHKINAPNNNNPVSSLVNTPVRINDLIKILTMLKEQLQRAMDPSVTSVQNNGDSGLLGNLLGSRLAGSSSPAASASIIGSPAATAAGLVGSILGSPVASGPAGTSSAIQGNNNVVSSLLNVTPDVNLGLNILSEITNVLKGASNKEGLPSGISPGSNPNEVCFDIPIKPDNTSVPGNNNTVSSVINVQPKINLDLNLLSSVSQTSQTNVATQRVCITMPHQTTKATPSNPSTPPTVPKVGPLLPAITPNPSSEVPTTGEICFYVWVDESATAGSNNQVNSLVNLPVNLNLDLNLLSKVTSGSANSQPNLVMRRVCIPGGISPTPSPVQPALERPIDVPLSRRCFRRTCTKWRHFVDHNCADNANEYPKYTMAKDVLY